MTKNLIGRRAAVSGALGGVVAAHSRIAWAADPIKIGFSIPQSGGLAAIGKQALRASPASCRAKAAPCSS